MALPSAIRSGQKATSMALPRRATRRSTIVVTPGNTVLRRTRSCPSTSSSATASIALTTAWGSGFRCSSTGVPTTTTRCSLSPTDAASGEAVRAPGRGSW